MTDNYPPANPLFASPSSSAPASPTPSRRAVQSAAKLGGYGGMAVAAWLVTAVATGYGLAGADTTGTSSESSSTSSASLHVEPRRPGVSTGSAASDRRRRRPAALDVDRYRYDDNATPRRRQDDVFVHPGWHPMSPSAAAAERTPAPPNQKHRRLRRQPAPNRWKITSGVETQPESSEPVLRRDGRALSAEHAASDPGSRSEPTTSTPAKTESDSTHSATADTTTPAASIGAEKVVATVAKPSATVTRVECGAHRTSGHGQHRKQQRSTAQAVAAAIAPAAPTAEVATPAIGLVGFLNGIVTNLLNPFLAPPPNTPEPVTPVVWAVLGWVRRNLFNQAPTITHNPTTSLQTGQTVTGNIGATDPEGDALTYTVTQATEVRHADYRPGDRQLHLHAQ